MNFVILNENEFNKFSRNYKDKCYLQSINVAELRKKQGWKAHYVGVKENDKVIAASLLLSKKRHIKDEFYAIRGPLVDFKNDKLLTFFINNIKTYIKENNGYFLRIDPYVEARSLDKDGKETNEFDNTIIKENLKKLGFKEVIAKEMDDTIQAKFMYVIDLNDSLESTMKDMDSKTRQMIRKNEKMGIVIKKGTRDDIPIFNDIMKHTSERRHFIDRGLNFYRDMYDCLSKDNMISFVFAELDINLALKNIELERKDIEKSRLEREKNRSNGKCNEKKAAIKEKEEEVTLTRLNKKEKELNELRKNHGEKITLGGILYIIYENEVASLFGGSYSEFKEYQPFYTIHYEMIKYAISNNYKRYNFYAINNHLDKDDEQYGIYSFKRGFGGHVMELLGEFILPIDKILYNSTNAISNLKHKIKK